MAKVALWMGLAFGLTSTALHAQVKPFELGPIIAQPGSTVSAMIEVPAESDPGTQIPMSVVHGVRPGPVLGLVAANHGYEYPPVLALQRLRARIHATELAGTVVLVHVANMPSFLGRTVYYSPVDKQNLNRVYPGKRDGTVSQRIAHILTGSVIARSDYVIDIHGGDGNESLRPYVYLPVTGAAPIDEKMHRLALAFGIDHIVLDRERPTDASASIYCSTTAVTRGKPALTVESGYLGTTDEESTDRIVRGVLSTLRHLKMLDGAPEMVEHPIYIDPYSVLTSPATGILYPKVERGHSVGKGSLLAIITDFFGKPVAEVRSPFSGIVLYVVATPPISRGEPIAMVGALRDK